MASTFIAIPAAGGSGAATDLSNLADVAINTDLLPDTDAVYDIGSNTLGFENIYVLKVLDTDGDTVLDVAEKTISDGSQVAVDILNRELKDDAGGTAMAFAAASRALYDEAGAAAISFTVADRTLYDDTGVRAVTFSSSDRILYDATDFDSIDYNGRFLIDAGGTVSGNYDTRILKASDAATVLEWADSEQVIFTNRGFIGTNTENQDSWGTDIPGLLIDATTGEGLAGGGGGLFLRGQSGQNLTILTTDETGIEGSAGIQLITGYTDGTGLTGDIVIASGNATGAAGDSGNVIVATGTSANGVRGSVRLEGLEAIFTEYGRFGTIEDQQSSWGGDFPGLSIDGESTAAVAAGVSGISFKDITGVGTFFIGTSDRNGTGLTSAMYFVTGDNLGAGDSGTIGIITGQGLGAGDSGVLQLASGGSSNSNSGHVAIQTGAAPNGTTGDILLEPSSNATTQGRVVVSARTFRLPTAAAAPTATEEGDMYYDTVTNKSYTWDGSAWQAHF